VTATFTMADRPARVGKTNLTVTAPAGVPEERRAALLAVASRCTGHYSLEQSPHVTIDLAA
jgi:putative redox protein